MKYLMQRGFWPSGNPRMYFRRKGQKLIPMPDAPIDAPEFLSAYAATLGEHKVTITRAQHPTGTIGAGIRAYLASDVFLTLSASSRSVWRRQCEKIEAEYGKARLADLRAVHIRKDMASLKPHPANNRLKVWRSLSKFWMQSGLIEANPAKEVERRETPKTDGYEPWTREDVAAFRTHWGIDTYQRLAFELMYRTSAAIGDSCSLGPGKVKDGWLTYTRSKSTTRAACPMRADLAPAWFEFNPDLEECLRHHPRHMTYLATKNGKGRSPKSATQWFARACRDAGLSVTAHGIRKFRAVQFRENGASSDQRMAILGHDTEEMAAHYSKSADLARVISGTEVQTTPDQSANSAK